MFESLHETAADYDLTAWRLYEEAYDRFEQQRRDIVEALTARWGPPKHYSFHAEYDRVVAGDESVSRLEYDLAMFANSEVADGALLQIGSGQRSASRSSPQPYTTPTDVPMLGGRDPRSERIVSMLAAVRAQPVPPRLSGWSPAGSSALAQGGGGRLERRHEAPLPQAYRTFLIEVSDGSAGLGYRPRRLADVCDGACWTGHRTPASPICLPQGGSHQ
ncbi:hypothetical protein GCM10009682_40710 [Luedemannella flava]|uniref:Uncharacterized protein n=1 Tax=Luedemannella flava TaxID=349316 RepID=A0ABN2M9X3_9ACTN